MKTEFAEVACTETYLAVLKVIRHTCSKFVRQNGGDVDDAISIANEAFIRAYNKDDFDGTKSSFATWIRSKVWYALLDEMRTRVGRTNRMPRVHINLDRVETEGPGFDTEGFLGTLSEDARIVAEMVLRDSVPLNLEVYGRGEYTPGNVVRGLKTVLKELGWSMDRITGSFEEIRTAVC